MFQRAVGEIAGGCEQCRNGALMANLAKSRGCFALKRLRRGLQQTLQRIDSFAIAVETARMSRCLLNAWIHVCQLETNGFASVRRVDASQRPYCVQAGKSGTGPGSSDFRERGNSGCTN